MPGKEIKLYALSTCVHCRRAKELLDEKGADYDSVYVDKLEGQEKKDVIEEVKRYNPKLSFPTLVIGESCIVGYKRQEIEEALRNR
jgi:glutaredoxin-like protein NrdH